MRKKIASRGTEIKLRLIDELEKFRAYNIKRAMTLSNYNIATKHKNHTEKEKLPNMRKAKMMF